jgi:LPXTG-motif cell wall-anchored protein
MKRALNLLAALFILVGGVWFFQGVGLLPGSFMSGQPQWAVYGGVAILVGAGLLFFVNRRRADRT